jgi:hypothetical protein
MGRFTQRKRRRIRIGSRKMYGGVSSELQEILNRLNPAGSIAVINSYTIDAIRKDINDLIPYLSKPGDKKAAATQTKHLNSLLKARLADVAKQASAPAPPAPAPPAPAPSAPPVPVIPAPAPPVPVIPVPALPAPPVPALPAPPVPALPAPPVPALPAPPVPALPAPPVPALPAPPVPALPAPPAPALPAPPTLELMPNKLNELNQKIVGLYDSRERSNVETEPLTINTNDKIFTWKKIIMSKDIKSKTTYKTNPERCQKLYSLLVDSSQAYRKLNIPNKTDVLFDKWTQFEFDFQRFSTKYNIGIIVIMKYKVIPVLLEEEIEEKEDIFLISPVESQTTECIVVYCHIGRDTIQSIKEYRYANPPVISYSPVCTSYDKYLIPMDSLEIIDTADQITHPSRNLELHRAVTHPAYRQSDRYVVGQKIREIIGNNAFLVNILYTEEPQEEPRILRKHITVYPDGYKNVNTLPVEGLNEQRIRQHILDNVYRQPGGPEMYIANTKTIKNMMKEPTQKTRKNTHIRLLTAMDERMFQNNAVAQQEVDHKFADYEKRFENALKIYEKSQKTAVKDKLHVLHPVIPANDTRLTYLQNYATTAGEGTSTEPFFEKEQASRVRWPEKLKKRYDEYVILKNKIEKGYMRPDGWEQELWNPQNGIKFGYKLAADGIAQVLEDERRRLTNSDKVKKLKDQCKAFDKSQELYVPEPTGEIYGLTAKTTLYEFIQRLFLNSDITLDEMVSFYYEKERPSPGCDVYEVLARLFVFLGGIEHIHARQGSGPNGYTFIKKIELDANDQYTLYTTNHAMLTNETCKATSGSGISDISLIRTDCLDLKHKIIRPNAPSNDVYKKVYKMSVKWYTDEKSSEHYDIEKLNVFTMPNIEYKDANVLVFLKNRVEFNARCLTAQRSKPLELCEKIYSWYNDVKPFLQTFRQTLFRIAQDKHKDPLQVFNELYSI